MLVPTQKDQSRNRGLGDDVARTCGTWPCGCDTDESLAPGPHVAHGRAHLHRLVMACSPPVARWQCVRAAGKPVLLERAASWLWGSSVDLTSQHHPQQTSTFITPEKPHRHSAAASAWTRSHCYLVG